MPSNQYPIIAREAWPLLLILLGLAVLAEFFISSTIFVFFLILSLVVAFLLRDPAREIPSEPLAIVSPAYGIVTLIEEAEEVRLKKKAIRIQVKTRPYDVYSLRAPTEGKVVEHWCSKPDRYESRRHFDFLIRTDEGDEIVTAIRLKNIIRKFHCYIHLGERLGQGQRCGYFYLGGVVDLFIPLDSKIMVEEGQYVQSGSSILAQIIHTQTNNSVR